MLVQTCWPATTKPTAAAAVNPSAASESGAGTRPEPCSTFCADLRASERRGARRAWLHLHEGTPGAEARRAEGTTAAQRLLDAETTSGEVEEERDRRCAAPAAATPAPQSEEVEPQATSSPSIAGCAADRAGVACLLAAARASRCTTWHLAWRADGRARGLGAGWVAAQIQAVGRYRSTEFEANFWYKYKL